MPKRISRRKARARANEAAVVATTKNRKERELWKCRGCGDSRAACPLARKRGCSRRPPAKAGATPAAAQADLNAIAARAEQQFPVGRSGGTAVSKPGGASACQRPLAGAQLLVVAHHRWYRKADGKLVGRELSDNRVCPSGHSPAS